MVSEIESNTKKERVCIGDKKRKQFWLEHAIGKWKESKQFWLGQAIAKWKESNSDKDRSLAIEKKAILTIGQVIGKWKESNSD